jgi:hypothetical protein
MSEVNYKICANCKHFEKNGFFDRLWDGDIPDGKCKNHASQKFALERNFSEKIDFLVTGKDKKENYMSARRMRVYGICGVAGSLYEPKGNND